MKIPATSSIILGGGQWRAVLREHGFRALEAEPQGECWIVSVSFKGDRPIVDAWGRLPDICASGWLATRTASPVPGMQPRTAIR
ncbi:MAG: hypothetical protein DRQ24_09980 [Candidatus Latescibacterota bacterium]|nr:MAG: hypothetical protein DRQ24_09980 [Candidatus Latescibacterota bacterium]